MFVLIDLYCVLPFDRSSSVTQKSFHLSCPHHFYSMSILHYEKRLISKKIDCKEVKWGKFSDLVDFRCECRLSNFILTLQDAFLYSHLGINDCLNVPVHLCTVWIMSKTGGQSLLTYPYAFNGSTSSWYLPTLKKSLYAKVGIILYQYIFLNLFLCLLEMKSSSWS